MCYVAALFAAQAAGSIFGAVAGASEDQAAYAKKTKAINDEAEAINRSTIFNYKLQQLQQQQIEDRTTAQVADERLKLADATGTGIAAAASGGVEGNSVQALLRNFDVVTGKNISGIKTQGDNEIAQSRFEMKGTELNARNRRQGIDNERPNDPSSKIMGRFVGAALGIASSYVSNTTKTPGSGMFGRSF